MALHPPTDPSRHGLDVDLGWALGVVFRAYAKASTAALCDVPGGPRGFQVLSAAAEDQHGTQLAVARKLGIDRTVMTYLLDDLEAAGLLQRTPDPNDRRARRLTVTPAGKQLLFDLGGRLGAVEEGLLDGLADDEQRALRSGLRRIALRVDAVDPVIDQCTLVEGLDR
jgi:DNA-binding MarR family transcriptional regulator